MFLILSGQSETLASSDYQLLLGGKGANQSIALAKADIDVRHVGAINASSQSILQQLTEVGVNTSLNRKSE